MKNIHTCALQWAVFLLAILPISLALGQGAGTTIDKIIVKVDNYIILQSDLEASYLQYLSEGRATDKEKEAKCQILQGLIVNKVLAAKAEIDSVIVDDSRVGSELDRRMQYMAAQFGSEKKIEEAYGKSIDALKTELRKTLKEQLTVQQMQDEITKGIKITPNEVKRFYNSIPKDSIPYFPTEVEIGQIVKVASVSRAQKNATKEKLNGLRERIINGEDFESLARTYSDDVESAKMGGNLGYSKRGKMVADFEAAALKLKPNELSQIVESEYGYHLIQLLDRRGDEYNTRHILIRPSYADVDLSDAEKYLDSLRTRILSDSITFEKAAKEYSDDKASGSNGGIISDPNSGSTKIFAENLDPVVYLTVDTMQVRSISKPVSYRTDDGKSAMRILYYKSKIAPHYANLNDDWQKIYNAALGEKKNKVLNEWFEKSKGEVYISIDPDYKECDVMQGIQ